MKYIRNQVELLEVILNRKFDNEELREVFQFVTDVYNDGLGDLGDSPISNEELGQADLLDLEVFI